MSKIASEIFQKSGLTNSQKFALKNKNIFTLLNVQPNLGVGARVKPQEWVDKGFTDSFYEIKQVRFKLFNEMPSHGKVRAVKYWRGVPEHKERKVTHGYKKDWVLA